MARLFIAVWPSPSVVDALTAIPRAEAPRLRWTTPDQWHVTLRYLGDAVEESTVSAALDTIAAGRTEAVLGPAVERLDPGLVVIPVQGLDALAAEVIAATADLGEPPHPAGFRGHLTLVRQREGDTTSADGVTFSARFVVDEIALVRSDLHHDGARYTTVARRRLAT